MKLNTLLFIPILYFAVIFHYSYAGPVVKRMMFNDIRFYRSFRARMWNMSVIFYDLDPHLEPAVRKAVYNVIQYVNNMPELCITWMQRYPMMDDYNVNHWVTFRNFIADSEDNTKCDANVGRTGGHQDIHIGYNCFKQALRVPGRMELILLHEMTHVMGLHHEHQRPDRDCFVYVPPKVANAWNMVKLEGWQFPQRFPYDENSIMHYGQQNVHGIYLHANRSRQLGRTDASYSRMDIMKLNHLYCGGPSWCGTRRSGMCVEMYSWMEADPKCRRQGPAYVSDPPPTTARTLTTVGKV